MAIEQVSANSAAVNSAAVSQSAKANQAAAAPQAAQSAQKTDQTAKTDTVTISKQAQQLANDGDTAAQEAVESGAEKASEALKGKK